MSDTEQIQLKKVNNEPSIPNFKGKTLNYLNELQIKRVHDIATRLTSLNKKQENE